MAYLPHVLDHRRLVISYMELFLDFEFFNFTNGRDNEITEKPNFSILMCREVVLFNIGITITL